MVWREDYSIVNEEMGRVRRYGETVDGAFRFYADDDAQELAEWIGEQLNSNCGHLLIMSARQAKVFDHPVGLEEEDGD